MSKPLNLVIALIVFFFLILFVIIQTDYFNKISHSLISFIKTAIGIDENKDNVFYSVEYVGIYNTKIGEIPQNCTGSGNDYSCKAGTYLNFYVGISKKGTNNIYIYPAVCVIHKYNKNKKCTESDYIVSNNPCLIDTDKKPKECAIKADFLLESDSYRIFPGARCDITECDDIRNTGSVTINKDNYLGVSVIGKVVYVS